MSNMKREENQDLRSMELKIKVVLEEETNCLCQEM